MKTKLYLLGIDNGGTVTKAALYDAAGSEIAVASVKTKIFFPQPGRAEKDMDALWAANVTVMSEVMKKARVTGRDVAAVAVTGHGNGLYLTDSQGRPACSGINSADSRAAEYVERWNKDGTMDKVRTRTCQSIWAAQPAALLAWFRDSDPGVLEKTRWIFMCKDYVRFRLTGEPFGEVTDYSGTNLMNVRDLRYDPDVLDWYGLSGVMDKLPPVRNSADICGRVTAHTATETGLLEGTPVAGGMFDIDACAIATGITDPDKLCLIAGSWSINEYISRMPVESPDLFMTSAYCIPGYWLITESSATSSANLEWVVTELMDQERREAAKDKESVYDLCNRMVADLPAKDSEVIFLPFLYGSNAGPRASAGFHGLHGWHTKAHLLRAVYEGIVFSHRTHVDRLMRFRPPASSARIAGGAAKSCVWVQMFADVLQCPIEVTAAEELGAMGAAISAAVSVGMYSSFTEAVAGMVKLSRTVEPDRSMKDLYQEKYGRYRRLIEALSKEWENGGAGLEGRAHSVESF